MTRLTVLFIIHLLHTLYISYLLLCYKWSQNLLSHYGSGRQAQLSWVLWLKISHIPAAIISSHAWGTVCFQAYMWLWAEDSSLQTIEPRTSASCWLLARDHSHFLVHECIHILAQNIAIGFNKADTWDASKASTIITQVRSYHLHCILLVSSKLQVLTTCKGKRIYKRFEWGRDNWGSSLEFVYHILLMEAFGKWHIFTVFPGIILGFHCPQKSVIQRPALPLYPLLRSYPRLYHYS